MTRSNGGKDMAIRIWDNLPELLFVFLTYLVFFCRSELVGLKIVLLLVMLGYNVISMQKKYVKEFNKETFLWICIYVAIKCFYMLLGELNGGDAFTYYWKIYLLEPVLYTLIIFPIVNKIKLEKVEKVLWYSCVSIVALLGITFVFFKLGIPLDILLALPCSLSANMDGNFIYISSMAIVGLLFLIPYYVNELFFEKKKERRVKIILILVLSVFVMLIIGRRALIAVSAISVVISLYAKYRLEGIKVDKELVKKILKIGGFLLGAVVIFLVFLGSELRFGGAGQVGLQISDNIRAEQTVALIQDWQMHPIIGSGYGINAENCVRSDIPGMYELSYLAMLAQTGIVGVLGHGILFLYLFKQLYDSILRKKDIHMLSVFIGFSCFLIGNATNPYLYSFDGLWILFYTLALLNRVKLMGE